MTWPEWLAKAAQIDPATVVRGADPLRFAFPSTVSCDVPDNITFSVMVGPPIMFPRLRP
jgi:hypothetical protein